MFWKVFIIDSEHFYFWIPVNVYILLLMLL